MIKIWYWIVYWDSEGKYGLDGPYNSNTQADRVAQKWDITGYEVEKLPTMNATKATRMVKAILAEREPEKFKDFQKFRHRLKDSSG